MIEDLPLFQLPSYSESSRNLLIDNHLLHYHNFKSFPPSCSLLIGLQLGLVLHLFWILTIIGNFSHSTIFLTYSGFGRHFLRSAERFGIYFVVFCFLLPQDHRMAGAGDARAAFSFSLSIISALSLTYIYMTPIAAFVFTR
jgi:hypothetical protein